MFTGIQRQEEWLAIFHDDIRQKEFRRERWLHRTLLTEDYATFFHLNTTFHYDSLFHWIAERGETNAESNE